MENQILIFSDLHHEETRHQAHRKSPGKVPANHPMECRFRGLGEGIKNRVQQISPHSRFRKHSGIVISLLRSWNKQLFQFLHPFRSPFPKDMYRTGSMCIHRLRIYQIHLCSSRYIMQQTCRRIYIERCADDNEYIRLLYISDSCLNLRHRLSEPDNKKDATEFRHRPYLPFLLHTLPASVPLYNEGYTGLCWSRPLSTHHAGE